MYAVKNKEGQFLSLENDKLCWSFGYSKGIILNFTARQTRHALKRINILPNNVKYEDIEIVKFVRVYLDDERTPKSKNWEIVRNYNEFVSFIDSNINDIKAISFDHDLGDDKTGYDCLKYICEKMIGDNKNLIPHCSFHTANNVGRENMESYYNSFLNSKENLHSKVE